MSRISMPAPILMVKFANSMPMPPRHGHPLGNDHALAMQRVAEINALKGPEVHTRQAGSLAALVAEFRQSPEHVKMADTTKALWPAPGSADT